MQTYLHESADREIFLSFTQLKISAGFSSIEHSDKVYYFTLVRNKKDPARIYLQDPQMQDKLSTQKILEAKFLRATRLFAPTLRESPAEAELISHKLMYRAGLIRKVAGGIYTYLPLGWRVIKKIEQIVREEMDSHDGQEIMMPIIQPAELWQESGRWAVYGDEMMRMKDRHDRGRSFGIAFV